MEAKKYAVRREHIGDGGRLYSPQGENSTREAFPHEVAHLVERGVLVEIADQPAEKPAEEAKNEGKKAKAEKAAKAAPENKVENPPGEAKNEG